MVVYVMGEGIHKEYGGEEEQVGANKYVAEEDKGTGMNPVEESHVCLPHSHLINLCLFVLECLAVTLNQMW